MVSDQSFNLQSSFLVGRIIMVSRGPLFNFEVSRLMVKVIQYCYVINNFRSITNVSFNLQSSYLVGRFVMVSRRPLFTLRSLGQRSKVKVIQYCYIINGLRSITRVSFNLVSSYLIGSFVVVSR